VLGQVRKLIHDQIKPVPTITLRTYEVAGEPIGVIEVPPGEFVYATHDNEILIRKGSTNRRPDPSSELGPLLAKRGASARVGFSAEEVF
jgi:predicted HTH transcriptional regulator